MTDNELDVDMEDFDDPVQSGRETAPPQQPDTGTARRGSSAALKIAILFVIVAAGGGVYLALFGHGSPLRARMMASIMARRAEIRHAPFPHQTAVVEKMAPSAPHAPLPVVNDKPPSMALLAPAPAPVAPSASPAPIPSMPSAPMQMPSMPTAPSTPISSAPASPFAIPSQEHATASAKPENNAMPMPAVAMPTMGRPHPGKIEIKGGKAMPAVVVPAVNKVDIAGQNKVQDHMPAVVSTEASPMPASMASDREMASPQSAPPADDSSEVRALKEKIALLEKTIAQLQQAPVVSGKVKHEKPMRHTSRAKKRVTHRRRVAHARHRYVERSHAPVEVSWVLKAAQPGVAWVARKGSGTLQRVKPGDSLTGIGQVEFIVHDSFGSWVVVGTKGRISQ